MESRSFYYRFTSLNRGCHKYLTLDGVKWRLMVIGKVGCGNLSLGASCSRMPHCPRKRYNKSITYYKLPCCCDSAKYINVDKF